MMNTPKQSAPVETGAETGLKTGLETGLSEAMDGLAPGDRVVVAMSGGVDSSVTAALLKARGLDVVGVTLQLYDHGAATARAGSCCAGRDILDARRVADVIGIPHYVLDYEAVFRRDVMEDFARSYERGETPVPCIACNRTVKFRDLLGAARDLDAKALATGHYVRRTRDADGRPVLRAAVDARRDQSYFLFATTPEQLAFLRFPLGAVADKEETRAWARKLGLPVAKKPDSQDICFVPQGRYADVVERLRPGAAEAGEIVHLDGRVLGRHGGVVHYTVGQRRGLGLGGEERPLYVVRLEPEARRVVVGPREALARRELVLRSLNWLGAGDMPPPSGVAAAVKVRSTTPPAPARVFPLKDGLADGRARVVFEAPQYGVAPGQACVFYEGEQVLGGGWITGVPGEAGTGARHGVGDGEAGHAAA